MRVHLLVIAFGCLLGCAPSQIVVSPGSGAVAPSNETGGDHASDSAREAAVVARPDMGAPDD